MGQFYEKGCQVSHPSFSHQRERLVASKHAPNKRSCPLLGQRFCGELQSIVVEASLCTLGHQKGFDLVAQVTIDAAGAIQEGTAILRLKRQRVVVEHFNLL